MFFDFLYEGDVNEIVSVRGGSIDDNKFGRVFGRGFGGNIPQYEFGISGTLDIIENAGRFGRYFGRDFGGT